MKRHRMKAFWTVIQNRTPRKSRVPERENYQQSLCETRILC